MAKQRSMLQNFVRQQAMGRSSISDWLVAGTVLSSTGAPSTAQTWGKLFNIPDGGGVIHILLAAIIPAPATSTPGIGRLRIHRIEGQIGFRMQSAANFSCDLMCALYRSQLNNTTTLWTVRDPSNPSDASRDDYLYLRGKSAVGVAQTTSTSNYVPEFDLGVNPNILIGGGEGIVLTLAANAQSGGGSVNIVPFVRTQVGPVA